MMWNYKNPNLVIKLILFSITHKYNNHVIQSLEWLEQYVIKLHAGGRKCGYIREFTTYSI